MNRAFINDAVRTPIGRVGGSLSHLDITGLLAPLIEALLTRNKLDPAEIDEVVVGNAAGPGGNPARVALLAAGLPYAVSGMTIDRQCGSGLEAINTAVRLVQTGAANTVIAGGAESPSTAPLRARRLNTGDDIAPSVSEQNSQLPLVPGWEFYTRARFTPPSMNDPEMGIAAENVAMRYGISRKRQDQFALQSHLKASTAEQANRFDRERIALPATASHSMVEFDECVRADCSPDVLASLPAAFKPGGSVTAGNACPINDGAALVLVQRVPGAGAALEFLGSQAVGVDPDYLGMGPVPATRQCLAALGLTVAELQQIEFNEAFAAQVLACVDQLGIEPQQLNPAGGALALGHPYGASGAILVTRLLHDLQAGDTGLATLGIGGGMGLSSVFRARH